MLKDICGLNPNRSWASRRATLGHNIWLIVETSGLSALFTAGWFGCFKSKWPFHIHHEVELIMLSTAILLCGAFFIFVASTLFAEARTKNRALSRAILAGDEFEFMLWRDDKVQIMMHVAVAGMGAATLVLFTVPGYTEVWGGALIFYLVSGCIVMYFITMLEMQSLKRTVWIQSNAPQHWLTQNSDEYFKKYRAEKAAAAAKVEVRPAA